MQQKGRDMLRMLLLMVGWVCLSFARVHAADVITYPRPESPADHRGEYAVELLRLALNDGGPAVSLQPAAEVMNQERALLALRSGQGLRVLWTMTTVEREALALPIRIPIYKGLIGWRLALVHASHSNLLASVKSAAQLAELTAGQAAEWPDTDILRANGLKVVTSTHYGSLFKMLSRGRFDYMPRSISEIWSEATWHRADGLMVDDSIVLHYPAAVYFFVAKSDAALAERIRLGLERLIADGRFDRLFYSYHAEQIERARLSRRRVIELRNPLLPPETPLSRPELWLRFPQH